MSDDELLRIVFETASGDATSPRFADRVSVGTDQ